MERLTGRTLRRAIEFAAEHERTSIAILMDVQSSATALYREIMDEYRNLRGHASHVINFSNDSIIRIYSVSDSRNVRGLRSNIVLIHNLVDIHDADFIFGRMENHEHGHPGRVVCYDASEDRYIEEFIAEDAQFVRGTRANNLIYDDFAGIDWPIEEAVDRFNSCQTGYTMNSKGFFDAWNLHYEYEFFIENGRLEIKKKEAPDFGEISPSQELNDFVATLVQGE